MWIATVPVLPATRALSAIARSIESAARARNAAQVLGHAEKLDDVCETCHKNFWFPDQKQPDAAS